MVGPSGVSLLPAQSTPVAHKTRSKKRVFPEPDPSSPSSPTSKSVQPASKKTKSQKKVKSVKSDVKASTKKTKVGSKRGASTTDPAVVTTSLTTATNTTAAMTTVPSTLSGDVNKTVNQFGDTNALDSAADDDDDAYDDPVTKKYISLKERCSSNYAVKGKKKELVMKFRLTDKGASTVTTSTSSSSGVNTSVAVTSSITGGSKSKTGVDNSKNIHQVIKENKRKRKIPSTPSPEPSFLPFGKDSSVSQEVPVRAKVAIDTDSKSKTTKKLASVITVPGKSTMVTKPSVAKSSTPISTSRSAAVSSNSTPLISDSRPPSSRVSSRSRADDVSSKKTAIPVTSSSYVPTVTKPCTAGSSTRSHVPPARQPSVKFSSRDGTVKLNSEGYANLNFRQDPEPLKYTTENRSQNHQM